MNVEHPLLSSVLWGGAVFAFVWALGILRGQGDRPGRHMLAGLLGLSGLWMLFGAVFFSGLARENVHLAFVHLPPLYAIGPLLYFYCSRIVFEQTQPSLPWLHFVPCLVVLGIALPFYVQPAAEKTALLTERQGPYFLILMLLNAGPKLSTTIYLSVFLPRLIAVLRTPGDTRASERRMLVIFLIVVYIALSTGLAGYALRRAELVRLSAGMLPPLIFALFILTQWYPNMMHDVRESARRLRYERSRINGLDVDGIVARLEAYMVDEQAFADEDLSLQSLANQLDIGPHQLSQILNERLGRNFHQYVNAYRVQAAQQLLLQEPDRSVLSVAFAVGFNSRSAFHKAFRRFAGENPRRFRARTASAGTPVHPDL